MNMTSIFKKITTLSIAAIVAIIIFSASSCNKGKVEIYGILDSVQNCTSPYVVYFYPDAMYGNGDVIYRWDFGDGTTSTERTPVHLYEQDGNYEVTLTIKNKEAEDRKSETLDLTNISIIPEWDFEYFGSGLWAPANVKFNNFSQFATSYYWDYSDNGFSYKENPEHIFEVAGTYNVTLHAMCSGDTVSVSKNIEILPAPTDIFFHDFTLWLPDDYIGANIVVEAWFHEFIGDTKVGEVYAGNINFPAVFHFNKDFFPFDGDYNDDRLEFEVWEEGASAPEYVFSIPMYKVQSQYYPEIIGWDNGYGFVGELSVSYYP